MRHIYESTYIPVGLVQQDTPVINSVNHLTKAVITFNLLCMIIYNFLCMGTWAMIDQPLHDSHIAVVGYAVCIMSYSS